MKFDTTQPSYVAFRDLVSEGTASVVAWVGAGLSRQAGMPTWGQLRESLTASLRASISSLSSTEMQRATAKLSQLESQSDPWLAFQILEDALGHTSFRDTIREQLGGAARARLPRTYESLWRLPISGLLNLNLDRIATRAYTVVYPTVQSFEFSGFQIENVAHVLKSPQPFILNLHGIAEDASSWVLTRRQLSALSSKPGYQEFINACLLTKTILFVGISADDVAVGGYLERLTQKVADIGTHYWITDRCDHETNKWAEKYGIRVIRYQAPENDHSALDEFFHEIQRFVPKDDIPPPVVLDQTTRASIGADIAPDELARMDAETIRETLNAKAQKILVSSNDDRLEDFQQFCSTFDEAIYRAWYTTAETGKNSLFGYRLQRRVARGAFGTVYLAHDKDENQVAVKVLNEELRTNGQMLESFRRGVRSMRILSQRGVEGMVPYLDASEIPAVVVMDWVDGPNLKEAIEARYIDDWRSRLRIGSSLANIIRRAHSLPERVLHRDVRPPNVMLKGYFDDPSGFEVVVLDFDLSWHLGATEKSVLVNSATGYLAPEQLQETPGATTRHASVDAFGLGMCLYYVVSGRDPLPAEHAHSTWQDSVSTACNQRTCESWHSLPRRYARVILNATLQKQSERWDMAQIEGELDRLFVALDSPASVASAELIAEELIARSIYGKQYRWREHLLASQVSLPSGLELSTVGIEATSRVELKIRWSSGGDYPRKRITKWLPEAGRNVCQILESNGWKIEGSSAWAEQVDCTATISAQAALVDLPKQAAMFEKVSTALRFE